MKRILIWLTIIMLGSSLQTSFVCATNAGFTTNNLDPSTIDTSDICLLTTEPLKETITCFDVSENGMFAIGTGNSTQKVISVYDHEGVFQYGYCFRTQGTYGIELDNGVVYIYFVRGDIVISLDSSGGVMGVFEVENTLENNTRWQQLLYSNERTVGDTKYIAENDAILFNWLTSSYDKLIAEKPNGIRTVVYDADNTHVVRGSFILTGAILFAVVCVYYLIKTIQDRGRLMRK